MSKSVFLSAAWKNLLMMNYEVPQEILMPFLPKGVELDIFQGKCLVSLVGFMFENTKVKGCKIPGHINFEEFNLRFYVFRKEGGEIKRGVVFVKEIVPKYMIAFVARKVYREPYIAMPMWHTLELHKENGTVAYHFGKDNEIRAELSGPAYEFQKGSLEDFITEHYWGYNKYSEKITMEYEVGHPSWKIRPVKNSSIHLDVEQLYGKEFVPYLKGTPHSAFMAEGSDIIVRDGTRIDF